MHQPGPYIDLGAWASLDQCGSGRSHRPATVAWSSVWPGRQWQSADSSVWPVLCCWWFLSWTRWAQVCLCFAVITEKSATCPWQSSQQDFMGQGSSLHDAVWCLAEWSSSLRWGCRHNPNLGNDSLGYEFIGVCETVLNRDVFTFPLTCLISQDWEDSKGSCQ